LTSRILLACMIHNMGLSIMHEQQLQGKNTWRIDIVDTCKPHIN